MKGAANHKPIYSLIGFSKVIAKRSSIWWRRASCPSCLGRMGILPVPFNRRAGSPSCQDYRLEACSTILYHPPILSVTGAKLLRTAIKEKLLQHQNAVVDWQELGQRNPWESTAQIFSRPGARGCCRTSAKWKYSVLNCSFPLDAEYTVRRRSA